jgi:hypothetical protein
MKRICHEAGVPLVTQKVQKATWPLWYGGVWEVRENSFVCLYPLPAQHWMLCGGFNYTGMEPEQNSALNSASRERDGTLSLLF